MSLFEKNAVLVSGVVAVIHVIVQRKHLTSDSREDEVYQMALEMQSQLRHEVEDEVRTTLGDEFELYNFDIRRGSAHILIVISTAGAIYMGFSQYESFVKSVSLLTSQLSGVFRRVLGRTQMNDEGLNIRSTWNPGPAITTASQSLTSYSRIDISLFLVVYLVLSHAALLALFFWLVIQHLR